MCTLELYEHDRIVNPRRPRAHVEVIASPRPLDAGVGIARIDLKTTGVPNQPSRLPVILHRLSELFLETYDRAALVIFLRVSGDGCKAASLELLRNLVSIALVGVQARNGFFLGRLRVLAEISRR